MLADEPTANIDSANADALLEMMETLNREQQVTFLFSTHDPRVMARARRLVRLVDGRIESDDVRACRAAGAPVRRSPVGDVRRERQAQALFRAPRKPSLAPKPPEPKKKPGAPPKRLD